MAVTKRITVNAKISEKEFAELTMIANRENISVSALMKLCIGALINGEIEVEKGELKTCPTHDEYCVSDDFYSDDFGKKVEKKFDRLRERDYPEDVIHVMKQEILAGIDNRIDMLPKKFDRRKLRDVDGGC